MPDAGTCPGESSSLQALQNDGDSPREGGGGSAPTDCPRDGGGGSAPTDSKDALPSANASTLPGFDPSEAPARVKSQPHFQACPGCKPKETESLQTDVCSLTTLERSSSFASHTVCDAKCVGCWQCGARVTASNVQLALTAHARTLLYLAIRGAQIMATDSNQLGLATRDQLWSPSGAGRPVGAKRDADDIWQEAEEGERGMGRVPGTAVLHMDAEEAVRELRPHFILCSWMVSLFLGGVRQYSCLFRPTARCGCTSCPCLLILLFIHLHLAPAPYHPQWFSTCWSFKVLYLLLWNGLPFSLLKLALFVPLAASGHRLECLLPSPRDCARVHPHWREGVGASHCKVKGNHVRTSNAVSCAHLLPVSVATDTTKLACFVHLLACLLSVASGLRETLQELALCFCWSSPVGPHSGHRSLWAPQAHLELSLRASPQKPPKNI